MQTIRVGIVGSTGYTGAELLRILCQHRHVEIAVATSRSERGQEVAGMFPNLRKQVDLTFEDPETADLKTCELVFFATPHGTAMHQVSELLEAGVRVIDLSADFRIKDLSVWEKWYGMPHACPNLLTEAVYGLPETNRNLIRDTRILANPGCYPTAIQLGFLPLLKASAVDELSLIADAKSGLSGGGRKKDKQLLFAESSDNFKAYGVSGHRHLPEICQGLTSLCNRPVKLTFVPHLIPAIRGIHATLYARISKKIDLQELFEQTYRDEPFVDVLPANSHPETRSVRGSNWCRIAVHRPQMSDVVVVLSVIDNLVKGAAGQAMQNMNIMFGFHESSGLEHIPVMP